MTNHRGYSAPGGYRAYSGDDGQREPQTPAEKIDRALQRVREVETIANRTTDACPAPKQEQEKAGA